MLVRTARFRRALHRIGGIDGDDVFVDVILVHVVQMPVVQVVDVAVMAYRRMPTVGTMFVRVVGMMLLGAGGHGIFSFSSAPTGPAATALRQHAPWRFPPTQNASVGNLARAFQARGTSPRPGPVPRAPAALAGSGADDDVSCAFSLRIRHFIFQRILE